MRFKGSLKTSYPEVNMLIRLTTIVPNTYVCHHQKGEDCWNKISLYNVSKVLMITTYWRTIGYANICSIVQDHKLKFNNLYICIRASEALDKLNDMVEYLKKCQLEVNIWPEEKKPLRSNLRPDSGSSDSESPRLWVIQTLRDLEGSLSVVQFVFFWITCLVKFIDKRNEMNNSTCSIGFRMSLPTTLIISGNTSMSMI